MGLREAPTVLVGHHRPNTEKTRQRPTSVCPFPTSLKDNLGSPYDKPVETMDCPYQNPSNLIWFNVRQSQVGERNYIVYEGTELDLSRIPTPLPKPPKCRKEDLGFLDTKIINITLGFY